jgi:hypothetical protein
VRRRRRRKNGCFWVEYESVVEFVSRDILVRLTPLDERILGEDIATGEDIDVQRASERAQIDAVSTFTCTIVVVASVVDVSPNDWQCRCC